MRARGRRGEGAPPPPHRRQQHGTRMGLGRGRGRQRGRGRGRGLGRGQAMRRVGQFATVHQSQRHVTINQPLRTNATLPKWQRVRNTGFHGAARQNAGQNNATYGHNSQNSRGRHSARKWALPRGARPLGAPSPGFSEIAIVQQPQQPTTPDTPSAEVHSTQPPPRPHRRWKGVKATLNFIGKEFRFLRPPTTTRNASSHQSSSLPVLNTPEQSYLASPSTPLFRLSSPPRNPSFLKRETMVTGVERTLLEVERKLVEKQRASARSQNMALTEVTYGASGTSPLKQQRYFHMVASGNDDLVFSTSASDFTTQAINGNKFRYDRFGFRIGGVRGAMLRSSGGGAVGGGGVQPGSNVISRDRAMLWRDNLRLYKWLKMKDTWMYVLRNQKPMLARRVRKGVPMALRGEMWCKFCGAHRMPQDPKCRAVYMQLLQVDSQLVLRESEIIQEVTRIYSSHKWYSQPGGQAQRRLFRVLRSLSLRRKDVGYTTSIGFLTAFFLLFMDELHAFWTLDILLSDSLPNILLGSTVGQMYQQPYKLHDMYSDGVPKLLVHLQVLDALLESYIDPKLAAHFLLHGVRSHMWAFDWFSSLFASSFPLEITVRVMDVFLFKGSWEVCYRTALAAVLNDRKEILKCKSFEEAMVRLSVLPSRIVDPHTFMRKAWRLKGMPNVKKISEIERAAASDLLASSPNTHNSKDNSKDIPNDESNHNSKESLLDGLKEEKVLGNGTASLEVGSKEDDKII